MSHQYWLHQPTSNEQQNAQQHTVSYWSHINLTGSQSAGTLNQQPQVSHSEPVSAYWAQETNVPVSTVQAQHLPIIQQHAVAPVPQQHHHHVAPFQHEPVIAPTEHHEPTSPVQQHRETTPQRHELSPSLYHQEAVHYQETPVQRQDHSGHAQRNEAVAPVPRYEHVAPQQTVAPLQHHGSVASVQHYESVIAVAPVQTTQPVATDAALECSYSESAYAVTSMDALAPVGADSLQVPSHDETIPMMVTPEPHVMDADVVTSTPISNPTEIKIPNSDESGQNSGIRQEEERDSHSSMVIVERSDVADAETARQVVENAARHQRIPVVSGLAESESVDDERSVAGSARGDPRHCKNDPKNVRERYKNIKKEYSEVMDRLRRYRQETPGRLDWRTTGPMSGSFSRLPTNSMTKLNITEPQHNPGKPNGAPKNSAVNPLFGQLNENDPALDLRKSRRERDQERHCHVRSGNNRPRTVHNGVGVVPAYPNNFYAVGGYGQMGSTSGGRYTPILNQSTPYYSEGYHYGLAVRRPMSSFEPAQRYETASVYSGRMPTSQEFDRRSLRNTSAPHPEVLPDGRYEAESYSDESEGEFEEGGSADELEQYNRNSAAMHQPNYADPYVQEEAYYYGVIKLRPKDVYEKQAANPPPEGYLHLKPIERVAYMFYYELYNDYFNPIERFSMLFNRELYKYKCEGLNDAAALEKICKHTADEYKMENEQRKKEKSKAYDRTQKQLFSDDRETPDSRMSGSVYEPIDDSLDLASIDSALKEPMKYRDHHSVLNFTVDGRLVSIDPASLTNSGMPFVKIKQVRNYVDNAYTKRLIEAMDGFKVPFNLNAPDDVTDFLEKHISRIMHSDVFQNNHSSGDATDCWLVWSLLSMLVRQRGTVTGRDLAGLLMRAVAASETDAAKSGSVDPDMKNDQLRLRASVNQLVLKGRIREVLELAEREGVFEAEAFALARRLQRPKAAINQELYPVDTVQLDNLEAKVLSRWPADSPLRIFMNVATYSDASLTNLPLDDPSSWRVHAAVVLANVEFLSDKAIKSIYQLGRTLARRDFHCAADFCFLTGNLLANYNPFQPVEATSDCEAYVRQHIDLIHATIPDDSINSCITIYGWSLRDLQATEIYFYARQLAYQGQPEASALSWTVAFQTTRMQYAEMMAEIAGMSSAAFEYFYVILLTIRNFWTHFPSDSLPKVLQMCEMADRLKFSVRDGQKKAEQFWTLRRMVRAHVNANLNIKSQQNNVLAPPPAPALEYAPDQHAEAQNIDSVPSFHNSEKAGDVQMSYSVEQRNDEAPQNFDFVQASIPTSTATNYDHFMPQADPEPPTSVNTKEDPEMAPAFGSSQYQYISGSSERDTSESHVTSVRPSSTVPDIDLGRSYAAPPPTTPEVVSNAPPPAAPPSLPAYANPSSDTREHHRDLVEQIPIGRTEPSLALPKTQGPPQSTAPPVSKPTGSAVPNETQPKNDNKGGGWFSGLTSKIAKAIPTSNEMKLPDDSQQSIKWDPVLNKWVGEGVEEVPNVGVPPFSMGTSASATADAPPAATSEAAAPNARVAPSGGRRTRYVTSNAFQTQPGEPQAAFNVLPTTSFGGSNINFNFIPAIPPNDDGEQVSAFSEAPQREAL